MEEIVLCELCSERIERNVGIVTCAVCDRIQHCSCAGLLPSCLTEITGFHCYLCETIHGETEYRGRTNNHRRNFLEDLADEKPVETCTEKFVEELKHLQLPRFDGVLEILTASELTLPYLQEHGFNVPVLVKDKDGLGITLPPNNFDVTSIYELIGKDFLIDVVDVIQQNDLQLKFQEFLLYFCSKHRKFPVCVPILDFSDSRFEHLVQPPSIVRDLDWVEKYWPLDLIAIKPRLQKYCSVSTKDCYTDFHTAFGGSSVWYYMFEGEEIFYLIEPTENNLQAYKEWVSSPNRSETFLANQVEGCYQLVLKKGETIFLPTGWIYASLTLSDTLVFGGNFLHDLNVTLQLRLVRNVLHQYTSDMATSAGPSKKETRIHDIENITSSGRHSYPMFELVNMYAGFEYVEELKVLNQTKHVIPEKKMCAVKALVERLKFWIHIKEYKIFEHVDKSKCQKLVKDMSKQLKQAERLCKSLKITKPEMQTPTNAPVVTDFIGTFLKEDDKTQRLKMTLKKVPQPVKLTLPKPSTYPYRNNKIVQDECGEKSKLSEEKCLIDHPWSIADASHSNGDLKIKLRIGRQSPDVLKISNVPDSINDQSFKSSFKRNTNSDEEISEMNVGIEQGDSPQLLGQNNGLNVECDLSGTKDLSCSYAESISDDSSSDIEVLYVGKANPYENTGMNLGGTSSDTSGNHNEEEGFTSSDTRSLIPHSSSNSVLDRTALSARLPSSLGNTELLHPEANTVSESFQTSTTIAEILSSSCKAKTGLHSSLTTSADLHPWETKFQERKITGLAQIDYTLADEAKPTSSRTAGGPLRSTISLNSEADGKLSICSRSRPNRKKKSVSRSRRNASATEDGQTEMGRVHEDDSFVYLSLETSDEEEEPVRKFRGKQYIDETWCPGARLGPLLPRVEKPVRDVKRNQAIEKGLEAAAAKKAGLPPPKRPYHIRKKRVPRPVISTVPVATAVGPSVPGVRAPSPVIASKKKAKKTMKPKRGMATAKQRLGKILKMNKMTF